MIRLADVVASSFVRSLNERLLVDPQAEYVVVSEEHDDRARILELIAAVPDDYIRQVLDFVRPFREEHAQLAWAQFMAGAVGQQMWPDGNHRTSMMAFDAAMRRTLGESIALTSGDAAQMLTGSKALLKPRRALPGTPVFTFAEISDPAHSLRRHFDEFSDRLVWTPLAEP